MMKIRSYILGWVMVSCLLVPLHATLIAFDSFANVEGGADYTIGALASQTATVGTSGYTGNWTGGTASMQSGPRWTRGGTAGVGASGLGVSGVGAAISTRNPFSSTALIVVSPKTAIPVSFCLKSGKF